MKYSLLQIALPATALSLLLHLVADVKLARADVTSTKFNSASDYDYRIAHLPDLDQRRTGLPGGGSMYCVPTAIMNVFAYMSNHGFPNQSPGAFNYQAAMMNNYTTLMLELLGSSNFMNTSATDGTNGTGIINGLNAWLHPDWFVWNYQWAAGNYAPSQVELTQSAINGNLIMYCFGRYTITGFNGSVPVLTRDSGHCVTLSRSFRNGNTRFFWIRDPGRDDGDPSVQSLFANTLHDNLANFNVQVGAQQRVMLSIDWPQSDNRYRLVDSWVRITTKQGYSFTNTGVQSINPFLPVGSPGQNFVNYDVSHQGATINHALVSHDGNDFWSLQTDSTGLTSLHSYNLITGQSIRHAPTPGATHAVLGRKRGYYVLMPNSVQQFNLDQIQPTVVSAASLTSPVQAMAYDDHFDHVVLLSIPTREILRYNFALQGAPLRYNIPQNIPLAGTGSLVINPVDHSMWFRTTAANIIFRAVPVPVLQGGQALEVTPIPISFTALRSFDIDSAGNVFAIDNGALREFRPNQNGYTEVQSAYAGFPMGLQFQIARNRTNMDPLLHEGPEWNHTPPDELMDVPSFADCLADIAPEPVADGVVNVADLLAIIQAWGPCPDPQNCLADIAPSPGGDGNVNVADLLAIIQAWGSCGP